MLMSLSPRIVQLPAQAHQTSDMCMATYLMMAVCTACEVLRRRLTAAQEHAMLF